jgi:hypothetical protein
MKILQLLERQIDTNIDTKRFHGTLRRAKRGHPTAFSKGRDDKNDPHMFQKYNHTPLPDWKVDGYDVFIRYLIQHDIENPHFPRVYNIKKIVDDSGDYITKFDVEKLLSYDKLNPEELLNVLVTTFVTPNHAKHWVKDIEQQIASETYNYNVDHLKEVIANAVGGSLRHGIDKPDDIIRLDSLKEAVKIFNTIRDQEKLVGDLHTGNILYRRTGHGVQLVLNDPFSYKRGIAG